MQENQSDLVEAESEYDGDENEEEDIHEDVGSQEDEDPDATNSNMGDDSEKKRRRPGRPPGKSKNPKNARTTPYLPCNEDDGTDTMPEDDIDPKGEEKVTADGFLKGGREYNFPTFTLPRHPTRLYCFSLDASKVLGFRDTYIFFLRNTNIKRVTASDEDREYLKDHNLLPSQLKSRAVTLVVARNLFRVFGHKVVRRGRPIKDDYFVGKAEENVVYDDTMEYDEENPDYAAAHDFARTLASHDGGPYKRHGHAILGFSNSHEELEAFVPEFVPKELSEDGWMLKCATSAADFNRRLVRNRPTSFLDLHTNVEQVSKISQPTRVQIQINNAYKLDFACVNKEINVKVDDSDGKWKTVGDSDTPSLYPLALMREQVQDISSIYSQRFSETDSPYYVGEGQTYLQNISHGLPQHMHGVVPFNAPQSAKKSRAQKPNIIKNNSNECGICHKLESATKKNDVPINFTLQCSQCATKYHPSCVDFDEPVIVAKVLLYDWLCSNCKLCSICEKSGNDDRLLFCDLCDRGFHTFCLKPALSQLPQGNWVCKQCGECQSCSNKPHKLDDPADFWQHVMIPGDSNNLGSYLCTYCDPCHDSFAANRYCPLCLHIYGKDSEEEAMVCCDICDRWVHVECDPQLTDDLYEKLMDQENPEFICVLCKPEKLDALIRKRTQETGNNFKIVKYKGHPIVAPPLIEHLVE